MERAQQLIVKSKYSFSEIAYACGFSDPKYFSKCFKKETGMTGMVNVCFLNLFHDKLSTLMDVDALG